MGTREHRSWGVPPHPLSVSAEPQLARKGRRWLPSAEQGPWLSRADPELLGDAC